MEMLGLRLKKERKRLGLSQVEFAKIGGVEPNAQGHYERGFRSPKADYLQRVSDAGVDVAYLFSGTASAHSKQVAPPLVPSLPQLQSTPMNEAWAATANATSILSALHTSLSDTTDVIVNVTGCFSLPSTESREQNFKLQITAFREDAQRFINQALFRIRCSTSRD